MGNNGHRNGNGKKGDVITPPPRIAKKVQRPDIAPTIESAPNRRVPPTRRPASHAQPTVTMHDNPGEHYDFNAFAQQEAATIQSPPHRQMPPTRRPVSQINTLTNEGLEQALDVAHNRAPASSEVDTKIIEEPDRYQFDPVRDVLGKGGMGIVYRAFDTVTGREVAIKAVIKENARDAKSLERYVNNLMRELSVGSQLGEHSNCGAIYGATLIEGLPAIVMQFIKGVSLDTYKFGFDVKNLKPKESDNSYVKHAKQKVAEYHNSTWSTRQATIVDLMIETLKGVAHAHAHGYVHRDLKPANVMIGPNGEVKVMDWGIAKKIGEKDKPDSGQHQAIGETQKYRSGSVQVGNWKMSDNANLTQVGAIKGSPVYMSPSQASGEPAHPKMDLYSAGAMFYELLTGRPPRRGKNTLEVLQKARDDSKIVRPTTLNKEVSPELESIVMAMMDIQDGYKNVQQALDDLTALKAGNAVTAHDYSTPEKASRWVRKNPLKTLGGAAAAALLAVVSGAGVMIAGANENAQRQEAEKERMELLAKAESAEKEKEAERRRAAEILAEATKKSELEQKLNNYINEGQAYRLEGDWKLAEKLYSKAITEFKESSELYSGFALARYGQKEYLVAANTAQQSVKLNSENAEGWYSLGLSNAALGQFNDAIDSYRRASELGYDYADYHLAKLFMYLGDQAEKDSGDSLAKRQKYSEARDLLVDFQSRGRAIFKRETTEALEKVNNYLAK